MTNSMGTQNIMFKNPHTIAAGIEPRLIEPDGRFLMSHTWHDGGGIGMVVVVVVGTVVVVVVVVGIVVVVVVVVVGIVVVVVVVVGGGNSKHTNSLNWYFSGCNL